MSENPEQLKNPALDQVMEILDGLELGQPALMVLGNMETRQLAFADNEAFRNLRPEVMARVASTLMHTLDKYIQGNTEETK